MEFTFPKDKVLHFDTLKNYFIRKDKIFYEPLDILKPNENQISIDNIDYFFTYLNGDGRNKGGNSIILKLFKAQNIDISNPLYEEPDLILKILKSKKARNPLLIKKSEKRFLKEVKALIDCSDAKFQNVITIYHSGTCKIFNTDWGNYDEHLFYTMEYAQYDLKSYVEFRHATMSVQEKLSLCISLAEGLDELRSLRFFHRDIKPDNIFVSNDVWKIGDLGLIGRAGEIDHLRPVQSDELGRSKLTTQGRNKLTT